MIRPWLMILRPIFIGAVMGLVGGQLAGWFIASGAFAPGLLVLLLAVGAGPLLCARLDRRARARRRELLERWR